MHTNMNKIGKLTTKSFHLCFLLFLLTVIASCSKDDDSGLKVPSPNKHDFILSTDVTVKDSLYEIYQNPYHIINLAIVDKEDDNVLGSVDFRSQGQNVITDNAGTKLGEIKYGKNDVLEINIAHFCTLKRQMNSDKGKMYIITPSTDKRNDIYISLSIRLDKGIGCNVKVH